MSDGIDNYSLFSSLHSFVSAVTLIALELCASAFEWASAYHSFPWLLRSIFIISLVVEYGEEMEVCGELESEE